MFRMNEYFETRRANAVRILAEKSVPGWKSIPATYRFVWSRGIPLRPPHFTSWEANFALFGGTAGVIAAVGTWLIITAAGGELALIQSSAMGVGAVIVYGFSAAARHKREAEDHGLPHWDDLPGVAEVFD
jgi:hypothetical protein